MYPLEWFFTAHPTLQYFCGRVRHVLAEFGVKNFDELVIRSRLPARSALLTLDFLIDQGCLDRVMIKSLTKSFSLASFRGDGWNLQIPVDVTSAYRELAREREEPALLWGQRRLIPESAIERATYILKWLPRKTGRIAFLGDDDLVSPLLASASQWEVHVFDIDSAVLAKAIDISKALGCDISVQQVNLATLNSDALPKFDLVVCDPYPSADGSFEGMFWNCAAQTLRQGGALVTTVAPSHKPVHFSQAAICMLEKNGFVLRDLQSDFGLYESFSFEFTNRESEILSEFSLESTVSHTKSLLVAELRIPSRTGSASFNFSSWLSDTAKHYLTLQADLDRQVQIATSRGIGGFVDIEQLEQDPGKRLVKILPPQYQDRIEDKLLSASSAVLVLSEELDLCFNQDEILDIQELHGNCWQPSSKLGLAIRAIESWERGNASK